MQDKDILSEDDYLRVKCLKNEFLNQMGKKFNGSIDYDEFKEYYSKSIFIYQIETIRSQEEYARKYDFKGPNGKYYSEFLESFDLDKYVYEYDSKGNLEYVHHYACFVENYEDRKTYYDFSYKVVPQVFYITGVVLAFSSDPFISIVGSAAISSVPSIAYDEYTATDLAWTCLMAITSSNLKTNFIKGSTISCDFVKTEAQFALSDKIPKDGDKFVYVTWGSKCTHNYVCNFPGGHVVKTYWFRNEELIYYEG